MAAVLFVFLESTLAIVLGKDVNVLGKPAIVHGKSAIFV
jgi:hypothetical protein